MHYVAVLGVTAKNVGDNLAERFWVKTFVDVLYVIVNILFRRRNSAHHISLVAHLYKNLICFPCKDNI